MTLISNLHASQSQFPSKIQFTSPKFQFTTDAIPIYTISNPISHAPEFQFTSTQNSSEPQCTWSPISNLLSFEFQFTLIHPHRCINLQPLNSNLHQIRIENPTYIDLISLEIQFTSISSHWKSNLHRFILGGIPIYIDLSLVEFQFTSIYP